MITKTNKSHLSTIFIKKSIKFQEKQGEEDEACLRHERCKRRKRKFNSLCVFVVETKQKEAKLPFQKLAKSKISTIIK
ncbi:CLUMA_CG009698, isoform A [Clunio marinus]|uniref:CLUMA_CG009698, isoform A n=1 Tax=Clunio marinus TaxID=568069 RepID=A0A1J1I9M6_9DIPT|nr:CLUMA_CG009698, isoform A [Clunio marinus]